MVYSPEYFSPWFIYAMVTSLHFLPYRFHVNEQQMPYTGGMEGGYIENFRCSYIKWLQVRINFLSELQHTTNAFRRSKSQSQIFTFLIILTLQVGQIHSLSSVLYIPRVLVENIKYSLE